MSDRHRYWIPEICLECEVDADADADADPDPDLDADAELVHTHGFCAFSLEQQQQDDDGRRTGGFCRRNDYGALELSLCLYVNSVADMLLAWMISNAKTGRF
jgi:hypothetical protein